MKVLITRRMIQGYCRKIADQITKSTLFENEVYWKEPVVLLGVMNGALPFLMDMSREIDPSIPIVIDTIKCSSYDGVFKKGKFKVTKMPDTDLSNRRVILVEDIVDTGDTINKLTKLLHKKYKNIRVQTCSLLKRRDCDVRVDYLGKVIGEDLWVVGYGLDDEYGLKRNLKDIYTL